VDASGLTLDGRHEESIAYCSQVSVPEASLAEIGIDVERRQRVKDGAADGRVLARDEFLDLQAVVLIPKLRVARSKAVGTQLRGTDLVRSVGVGFVDDSASSCKCAGSAVASSELGRAHARERRRVTSAMHPRQRPLTTEIESLWLAALDDAGVPPSDALLYTFEGQKSGNGDAGRTWVRDVHIDSVDEADDIQPRVSEMNEPECIGAYRVALWTERRVEGIAAPLRHELEHGRQLDRYRVRLSDLHALVVEVLQQRAGSRGGFLYQLMPVELDANAAAGVFARAQFGDDRIEWLIDSNDEDVAAFRSLVPAPPLDELPTRMVYFLAVLSDLCKKWATDAPTFRRHLNKCWHGLGDHWARLVEDEHRSAVPNSH
jgi:hypothetical protein